MLQGELDLDMGSYSRPGRSKRPERLFFGALLDVETGHHVDWLRRHFCNEHRIAGTPRGRKRLHISLHHVGDYTHLPSRIIYAAKRAGQAVSMAPFDVVLHTIESFHHERAARHALVLHAEGAALVELHRMLGTEMRILGLKTKTHFRPHVTVLYGPDIVAKRRITPIRFTVKDFAFIHSELGLSKYNVIDRWPLDG